MANQTASPAPSSPPTNAARVQVRWVGALRFDTGRPDGPVARLDGSAETGQGPIDALLSALGTCAATDIVEILAKARTPVDAFVVEIVGERADTVPRRLRHVDLHYRIEGKGIQLSAAERAVVLALTKYCSVRSSLDPGISMAYAVALNGEAGARIDVQPSGETSPKHAHG